MQLSHTFTVSLPIDEAWKTFLDLERVAPCLPGASITDVEGDAYHGGVKIKIGPISAQYRGIARLIETDDTAHRAVISAQAKDVGGQGNANATITATLEPQGDGTHVRVDTDLDLSGRVAQFGRGVISDVSGKLLNQFSKNLEVEINRAPLRQSGGPTSADTFATPTSQRRSLDDVEPLDVMSGMGSVVAKYALPALGGLALVAAGAILLSRRSRSPQPLAMPAGVYPSLSPGNVFSSLPAAAPLPTAAAGAPTGWPA